MKLKEYIDNRIKNFILKKGTIIKKEGIPFYVNQDTEISGTEGNAKIAKIVEYIDKKIKKILTESKIISIQFPTENIDVNKEFSYYKYAIPEHEPIKLSNGNWLHVYRVSDYDDDLRGDDDVESDFYDRELNGD